MCTYISRLRRGLDAAPLSAVLDEATTCKPPGETKRGRIIFCLHGV